MGTFLELLKVETNKYRNSIELIIGFFAMLVGLIDLATKIFESKYNLALLCIGAFFIIKKICKIIITTKRESFNITIAAYSNRTIKISKVANFANYLLLIFPGFIVFSFILPQKKECRTSNNLALVISSFRNSADDDFSYALFNKTESELQNVDSIDAIRINEFINAGEVNYLDSIRNIFKANCFVRGLLVFGKRSKESELFDCNIFINNLNNLHGSIGQLKGKDILYLQNPDLINFSIDSQANVVSEFILGLLYYNNNNFSVSSEKLSHALTLSGNLDNKKFVSFCHLFIGNNCFKEKRYSNAIYEYKKGITFDSSNAFLHYNLASALMVSSERNGADAEYTKAQQLNNNLNNPIKLFFTKDQSDLRSNSTRMKRGSNHDSKISIGKSHKPVDSSVFQQANTIKTEYKLVVRGNKSGMVNIHGDTIIKCEYDYIDQYVFNYKGHKYFIVRNGPKFGALDVHGNIEIPINHPSEDYLKGVIQLLLDNGDTSTGAY